MVFGCMAKSSDGAKSNSSSGVFRKKKRDTDSPFGGEEALSVVTKNGARDGAQPTQSGGVPIPPLDLRNLAAHNAANDAMEAAESQAQAQAQAQAVPQHIPTVSSNSHHVFPEYNTGTHGTMGAGRRKSKDLDTMSVHSLGTMSVARSRANSGVSSVSVATAKRVVVVGGTLNLRNQSRRTKRFSPHQMQHLISVMTPAAASIKHLLLGGNSFQDTSLKQLMGFVRNSATLRTLELSSCSLNNQMLQYVLSVACNPTHNGGLKTLNVGSNALDGAGVRSVMNSIQAANSKVENLIVSRNPLGLLGLTSLVSTAGGAQCRVRTLECSGVFSTPKPGHYKTLQEQIENKGKFESALEGLCRVVGQVAREEGLAELDLRDNGLSPAHIDRLKMAAAEAPESSLARGGLFLNDMDAAQWASMRSRPPTPRMGDEDEPTASGAELPRSETPPDSLWAALGLPEGADVGSIKTAYRQHSLHYHPDRLDTSQMSPEEVKEAQERWHRISLAHEVLTDMDKRRHYMSTGKTSLPNDQESSPKHESFRPAPPPNNYGTASPPPAPMFPAHEASPYGGANNYSYTPAAPHSTHTNNFASDPFS